MSEYEEIIRNIKRSKMTRRIEQAITDPKGIGMLNLMLDNACVNGDGVIKEYRHLFYNMPEDALCIDCGMNIGYFTDIVLFCGGKSIGFEPNPTCIKWLNKKYKDNNKVIVNNVAVSDKNGEVTFYREPNNDFDIGGNIIKSKYVSNLPEKTDSYKVDTIKLSDYILNLKEDIYLLKLDVEGSEFDIIPDLINSGAYKKCQNIVFEEHTHFLPEYKPKLEEIKQTCKDKDIHNIDWNWS